MSARTRLALRIPFAVLALTLAVTAGQVAGNQVPEPDVIEGGGTALDAISAPTGDLARIRANVEFWSARSRASAGDFVSSTRWAASEIELARATGDVTRYLAAEDALDAALEVNPDYRPALGYRAAVLIALHEFRAAADEARQLIEVDAADPVALATLGDAALALGDMDTARGAYQELSLIDQSAAALARESRLAFVDGIPVDAVELSRKAVNAAVDEGLEGSALAWYRYQLGETLASAGDLPGAGEAYTSAFRADPSSPLAHWGLARIAAADEDWDTALEHLEAAIAIVPSPEYVARRADIYRLRGATGDARRERDDRRTVLAIGDLAGEAAGVYDRTLSLYLSSHNEDPKRALRLAENELVARKDVYGYDALAWALLANGRTDEAREQMAEALALGTRDAKLLYHAGMIEARLGNDVAARAYLEDALGIDPSFDPLAVHTARTTLQELR